MDDNSLNLLSLDQFQNRYDIRVRPLMFFGMVSAVKSLQRQILGTHQQYEFKVLSTHFSKAKNHLESFTNNKWHKDFCSSTDENVNSRNVLQAANICTTIWKLINFKLRFLLRRLPTNSYLQKYEIQRTEGVLFAATRKRIWRIYFGNAKKPKIFGITSRYGFSRARSSNQAIT